MTTVPDEPDEPERVATRRLSLEPARMTEMEHQWDRDGLGYWVARLHQPLAGLPAGTCVGVGGCA